MSEHPHHPTRAQAVDWERPVDDSAIAARLDALAADDIDPEELLDTLDVLAEELVGRTGATATGLKERIRRLREQTAQDAVGTGEGS